MDILYDDSRDGKLIDDYLFGGCRSGVKPDQQFAKPIEDEDIFGIGSNLPEDPHDGNPPDEPIESLQDLPNRLEREKSPYNDDSIGYSDVSDRINENVDEVSPITKTTATRVDPPRENLDDVFLDDYSQDPVSDKNPDSENVLPASATRNASRVYSGTTPCLAKLKMAHLKEKIRLQHLTRPIKPLGIGHDIEESLELSLEIPVKQSDPNFEKILSSMSSKKSNSLDESVNHYETIVVSKWEDHKTEMRRRICAQKRKIWDQFQKPVTDDMDDEEELLNRAAEKPASDDEEVDDSDIEDVDDGVEDEDVLASGGENEDDDEGDGVQDDDDDEMDDGSVEDNVRDEFEDLLAEDDKGASEHEIESEIDNDDMM